MNAKKLKNLLLVLISLLFAEIFTAMILFLLLRNEITGLIKISFGIILSTSFIVVILLLIINRMMIDVQSKTIKRLEDSLLESLKDREKQEEEKNDLTIQLRHTQKLETIGTLAGGMAHDFNNLLSPILGYSDLVLSQLKHDNTLYLYVNEIVRAANKAKNQVEQILNFSRKIEKDNTDMSLETIIKETVTIIRPLIPSTVEIIMDIGETASYANVDSTAIHQILVNICTNGWQAMAEKGGKLTISISEDSEDNEFFGIAVTDTGIGMSSETKVHIFEPFFSTKTDRSSSGLGLSVVQGILSGINGKIDVNSNPGSGSTFTFYLPKKYGDFSDSGNGNLKEMSGHILVVDDDMDITAMICNMLADFGFKIELFSNSRDALQAFKNQPNKFKLVISDLTMPNMTGSSLKKEIEKIRHDIPVLIMTGYGSKDQIPENKILKKPFIKKELLSAIEDVMQV